MKTNMSTRGTALAAGTEALAASGVPAEKCHLIGDAHEVGNLMSVIREAYELCYTL